MVLKTRTGMKCSVLKETGLVRTEKTCTDGLGSKGKSHSNNLNGVTRNATVGKNVTYAIECYTDRDSRVGAMSSEAKKGYDYDKLVRKWAKDLSLRHKTDDAKPDLMKTFPKLFEGIGQLPGKYKIKLKTDEKLVHLPARNIWDTLSQPCKKELNRMCNLSVIAKVTEATDWGHTLVYIVKACKSSGFVWNHVF